MAQVNVNPIERSLTPIGTIEEAANENLSPEAYATCAKPDKMRGIVGCAKFELCRVSAKGVSGPRNYGVEILKGEAFGGGMVRVTADCLWIADKIDDIEDNKGSLRVIANEGESYKKVTSILINNATNEPATNPFDPQARREERVVEVVVPAFPRPGQNKSLLHDMLRAETAQAEKERRSSENLTRNLGLGDTVAPLDKRDAGNGKPRK